MEDGVLLSETAFPKDGKEVDGKKEKRVLCGWLGGKHSKVDLKARKTLDMELLSIRSYLSS